MNSFKSIKLTKTLVVVAAFVLINCCTHKKESKKIGTYPLPKPIEKLYGNWLYTNLIDSVSERKNMTSIFHSLTLPFAYEIQFDLSFGDSALIYNSFEQYFLEVTIKNDSVILNNAVKGEPLVMIYDTVSATLKMMINRKDNYPLPAVFYKVDEKDLEPNGRFAEAFTSLFNQATIAGSYIMLNNQQTTATKITFYKNGTLNGYRGGYRYQCCTGGDCFEMIADPANTLTIFMKDQPNEEWAWKLSSKTDTLTLVKLKASNPEEPGTYKLTNEILKLVRD